MFCLEPAMLPTSAVIGLLMIVVFANTSSDLNPKPSDYKTNASLEDSTPTAGKKVVTHENNFNHEDKNLTQLTLNHLPSSQLDISVNTTDYRNGSFMAMSNSSLKRDHNSQGTLNLTLNDDTKHNDSNISFDERARSDAFKLTTPKENPYSVLLMMILDSNSGKKVCTGSLLTDEWVLTAAHCVANDKVSTIIVYAGGNSAYELEDGPADGSQTINSTEFYIHPNYTKSKGYDVAVVKTKEKFNLTETVNTIELSTQPWAYHSYYGCKITGFGVVQMKESSKDNYVRKTHELQVKNPCICSYFLGLHVGPKSAKRFICTKPKEDYGVCGGDSGGGLVCDGKVMATAMQIIQLHDISTCQMTLFFENPRCGDVNSLSVFQDTCPFVRWINSHVNLFNDSDISPKCVDTDGQSRVTSTTWFVISLVLINFTFYWL